MSRWDNNKGEPYIVFVAKLGNGIAYRDLPSNLKTNSIADHFGATAVQNEAAGTIVCGSHGEVANDRTLREQFEIRSNGEQVTSTDVMDNQRHVVWYELGLWAQDQLRQRMAFALSELITIVPENIDAETYTEVYTKYYDIFVNNAFGNYADIMKLVSYSPLMAEHLTYLKSKSHPYIFRKEDKRVSSPGKCRCMLRQENLHNFVSHSHHSSSSFLNPRRELCSRDHAGKKYDLLIMTCYVQYHSNSFLSY